MKGVCIALGIATVVFGLEWLKTTIAGWVLIWHMQKNNCPLPTETEKKEGSNWVWEHMIRDFFGRAGRR